MDKKVNKSKKIRGNSRFFVRLIIICMLLITTGKYATRYLKNNALFEIKNIQIKGNKLLDSDYLISISDSYIGKNLFDVDIDEIKLLFLTVSRVKDIKVQKIYPNKIVINVYERKGLFFIRDNQGEFYPIDENKVVLDKADWYTEEDIPIINIIIPIENITLGNKIEDQRIDQIYDIYHELIKEDPRFKYDISEFYLKPKPSTSNLLPSISDYDICFIDIKSGCRVILSSENIQNQIQRFIFLRDNQGFKKNSTIDLRFASQIVVS